MPPEAVDTELERFRHRLFVTEKLGMTGAALATGPFFLAYYGAPTLLQSSVFAFGFLPLAAAMLVAQGGRIAAGHALTAAALLGVALLLLFGFRADPVCALLWLVLAQFEVVQSGDRRAIGSIVAASALAILAYGIVAAAEPDVFAAPRQIPGMTVVAAVIAAVVIGSTIRCANLVRRSQDRQNRRWQAVAEALGDAVVGFDAVGSVISLSPGAESLLAATDRDLLGRGLFEHVQVADRPAFLKLIADAACSSDTQSGRVRLRHRAAGAAGEPRHVWIEMRTRRVSGAPGQDWSTNQVVAILRDVTGDRDQAAEIDRARQAAESAIRSKDQFLANMSHELRTPLNAIIGFSDMLGSQTLRPSDPAKQREYARIILQSGQHLLAVVNSVLDMSKLQAGTFAISPERFAMGPLVEQCCDMVALTAKDDHIEIVRDLPGSLEDMVGDERACKQILLNLLSNAVKFTPSFGRVTIAVRPEGTSLKIRVEDSGIGIAPADLGRLGEPFFQARSSLNRPFDGTGLGLSIVRGLVGLHGGSVDIESQLGRGTTVSVRLPLDCRALARRAPPVADDPLPRFKSQERDVLELQSKVKKIA